MTIFKRIISISLIFLGSACATYAPQYANEAHDSIQFPNKAIAKTFYLIGDAGTSPEGGMSKALTVLRYFFRG
jgi:hypothetical protein